ncbi:MAG: hypothetical protein IAA97_05500 [Spirochaetes bacterium]|uniref:Tetratricopeptide repeat protein n=1 Tax=Candidatus Ornithospirochaeta stercoripullorum TaxID=2840899 RepID=A0A9D9H5A4_9SPIO|nr:hypothetical protein [Candidatus Ornithospirochaeta stercoripullorum]
MKRLIMLLLTSLLLAGAIYAYTDSFSEMQSDPLFLQLLDAVKNGKNAEEADEAYTSYMQSTANPLYLSRAEYHMVRYYMDMGMKEEAEEHLEKQKEFLSLVDDSASEVERLVAQVDSTSSEYYVTKKLGAGMENNKLVKELYKKYPDEFYAALQEGFRLIYAPPIAGGSDKKALKIFSDIESNQEGISHLDYYSLLVGKAMALSGLKEYEESEAYLDRACEIYSFDVSVPEIRSDNAKGLKK